LLSLKLEKPVNRLCGVSDELILLLLDAVLLFLLFLFLLLSSDFKQVVNCFTGVLNQLVLLFLIIDLSVLQS